MSHDIEWVVVNGTHRLDDGGIEMRHFGWITAMLIGMLAWLAVPASAGEDLPAAAHTRIILHGVGCSVDNEAICLEDRPVFDEVFDTLDWDERPVVIQMNIVDTAGDEVAGDLSQADAEAVQDY